MSSLRYYDVLYNTYGDDQINIFGVKDYHVFAVADGVSECQLGRIASIIACSTFEEFLTEKISKSNQTDLEETIIECFNGVGETLKKINHGLRSSLGEWNIDGLISYIKNFINKKGDLEKTPENLVNDKVNEIQEKLKDFIESNKDFSFETTLSVAVAVNYKLYTATLGDIEIYMYRKNRLYPHYVLPKGGTIETYLSSDKGVVGPVDFAMRRLEKSDVFILCSDGANLSYAPRSGYPYALFINTLVKSLKNGKDPAHQWLNRLGKEYNGKLHDDFSLIIVEVQ